MNYQQALEYLKTHVSEPRVCTDAEISSLEQDLGCLFPGEYREFLLSVGPCSLFREKIEFYDPRSVRALQKHSFETVDEWVGSRVLPVGYDHRLQEVAGYLWNRPAGSHFVVMTHEYYFEDLWDYKAEDEAMWFRSLSDWILEIAETDGRLEIH